MKKLDRLFTLALSILIPSVTAASAQISKPNDVQLSGQWFLSYRNGQSGGLGENSFLVKRGYVNIKKRLNDTISGRITPDITIDREGNGAGDLKMRLKYCYVDLAFKNRGFLVKPHVEFGLVHRPWIGFEDQINVYRMQGKMFLERNDILSSSDFGLTFFSLLGGEMDDDYQQNVSDKYPGTYGSIALGVYNGGGYHAIEQNNNKTFESRITLRPLSARIPGFQVSYHGVIGEGNRAEGPRWSLNALFASLEHRRYVLTGMYFTGTGNYMGDAFDNAGNELEQSGYSLFGEVKLFDKNISLIGRYDLFEDAPDSDDDSLRRVIAGVAYHLEGGTNVLVDYDLSTRGSLSDYEERFAQVTIKYNF